MQFYKDELTFKKVTSFSIANIVRYVGLVTAECLKPRDAYKVPTTLLQIKFPNNLNGYMCATYTCSKQTTVRRLYSSMIIGIVLQKHIYVFYTHSFAKLKLGFNQRI